ncbi:MAG: efflux RND transporter periplasmic adaptor subunit [Planctomycetota bacterium]
MITRQFTVWFCTVLLVSASAKADTAKAKTTYQGFTEAYKIVEIATAETGVIDSVHIKEGAEVEAGDALGELDYRVLKLSLEAAQLKANSEGSVNSAKSALRQKKNRLEKLESLGEKGHASPEELEVATTELEIALANLKTVQEQQLAFQKEAQQIEARIQQRILRSPCKGTVIEAYKCEGELLNGNDSRFAKIVVLDQLKATFYVQPEFANQFAIGSPLSVQVQQTTTEAAIEFISPVIDSESNTVRIVILIDNQNRKLRAGSRCILSGRAADHPNLNRMTERNKRSEVR